MRLMFKIEAGIAFIAIPAFLLLRRGYFETESSGLVD